jgi:hypothetical protein
MQRKEVDRSKLVYISQITENESVDMLFTENELKRARSRASDPKNISLIVPKIKENPKKCTFWSWLFFMC